MKNLAHSQRGVIGIVALMFILIVTLFAMSQAATISTSNIIDSSRQADSVEALFLAESAIEYAGGLYVSQATPSCTNTAHTGVGTSVSLGRGTWSIVNAYLTSFGGSGTLPTTPYQVCRIRVQGKITSTGVTRTIDTIVSKEDDVISIASLNPNFNDPLWGCKTTPATCSPSTETRDQDFGHLPNQWILTGGTQGLAYIGWDKDGGPEGSRAAFTRKTTTGIGAATTGGAFTITTPISITAPKVLRLTFDFRVWAAGASSNQMQFSPRLQFNTGTYSSTYVAGGDCDNSVTGECQSDCTIPNCHVTVTGKAVNEPIKNQGSGSMANGCGYIDTSGFESGFGMPSYNAGCKDALVPSGSTGYKTGYLTYSIPGSGSINLTGIDFKRSDGTGALKGKSGSVVWIWIDNLRLSVPGVNGGGPSKVWREVPETAS
jgi:Tfp pilus assembly protein PilX